MPSELDLASLVATRICHDVAGAVGAIQNGLELMAEDETMTVMALDLITKSSAQATAKLQFSRMVFGSGAATEPLDLSEAARLTGAMFSGERSSLAWTWTGATGPRGPVRLAMLLATIAVGAVPRGGTVTVMAPGEGVAVRAEGAPLRTPQFLEVLTHGAASGDPRAVPALVARELAAAEGWELRTDTDDAAMTLRAAPR